MSDSWSPFFDQARTARQQQNRQRSRGGASFDRDDVKVDFGSNDYLGLTRNPPPSNPRSSRFGSGASPVLSGYVHTHQAVEQLLSKLAASDDALVFSSGYGCNVGVLSALVGPGDLVLSDALNHASLIDGIRLSKAAKFIYEHNQLHQAEEYLARHRHEFQKVLIVTESVFSMDGDTADLATLVELAEQYNCGLVVDEAHGLGVYGTHGGGLTEELGLQKRVLAKLGTLSKAVGAIGGYVCGSQPLIDFLVNHCRAYLFSTAPPLPVMEQIRHNLLRLQGLNTQRTQLAATSEDLRKKLRAQGWDVPEGSSPIVPILVGSEERALALSHRLLEAGILVPAIRPPTVPAGACRLRVSLSCAHEEQDILALLSTLGKAD